MHTQFVIVHARLALPQSTLESKQRFDGYKGPTSGVVRESLPTRFYTKHSYNMNTRVRQNPFSGAHMGITKCFCGSLTVEDHDFCFCSPECARADAMAALGGEDSHYRKVVRKAYVSCGALPPAIYRRKAEEKISTAKPVPVPRPVSATHQPQKQNIGAQNDGSSKKRKGVPYASSSDDCRSCSKSKAGRGRDFGENPPSRRSDIPQCTSRSPSPTTYPTN